MTKVPVTGEIRQYWGKPLTELKLKDGTTNTVAVLKFAGETEAYDNIAEVRAANDYPKDDEVVKFRNTQRKANERQRAMLATVTAAGLVQPTAENDPQLRLRKMRDLFLSNIPADVRESNPTAAEQQAREQASAALGIAWEDEDE